MAYLDVSDVLLDPTLTDVFTVTRRAETVNGFGESVTATSTYDGVVGVVCTASPNDLERLPEMDRMGRHLSVVTRFRLQGPAPGFKPDLIEWNGDAFVVEAVDPYPQYGAGFVQAIVGSIDSIDEATEDRYG